MVLVRRLLGAACAVNAVLALYQIATQGDARPYALSALVVFGVLAGALLRGRREAE